MTGEDGEADKSPLGETAQAPRGPTVVVQSGDAFENRMRVLPLAISLRDHGWSPIVLVDDIGASSAFLVHGLGCVSVAALPDDVGVDGAAEFDIDDLCALTLRRRFPRGLGDEEWRSVRERTARLWWMLDQLAPDAIFVWNGFTGIWANALRTYKDTRGLPGGFMERAPFAGAVFVDPLGVNGRSSLSPGGRRPRPGEPRAAFSDLPPELRPPDLEAAAATSGREPIVFVPLQVQDDSNVLLHSPRIQRMRDLANFAIRLAERLGSEWRVVLRPHPEEAPGVRLNLPIDERTTVDAETPLGAYLDRAAICLTVNSTVGLLASLRGALTVCLGEGVYCRRPFVLEAHRFQMGRLVIEVEKRLEAPPMIERARAFLDELVSRSLFWPGQAQDLASAKLSIHCGLDRAGSAPVAEDSVWSGGVRVLRGGAGFARAAEEIAALRHAPGELVADFDFAPGETRFLTYRNNREPLTREALAACASATLGRRIALAGTHRALGRNGCVLIGHSKRVLQDLDGYALVLDEFGLPHARTYLAPAQP